jgi:hypothetical protein
MPRVAFFVSGAPAIRIAPIRSPASSQNVNGLDGSIAIGNDGATVGRQRKRPPCDEHRGGTACPSLSSIADKPYSCWPMPNPAPANLPKHSPTPTTPTPMAA